MRGLNRAPCEKLVARKELVVVPHATYLFEEPGTLAEVARLARDWFTRYLVPAAGESAQRRLTVRP